MVGNYWHSATQRRLSRRRALAATAAGIIGTTFLASCGGDDGGEQAEKGTLLTPPVDTTKQARRGGIIKDRTNADVANLDGLGSNRPRGAIAQHVMNGLWQFKPGYLKPQDHEVVPDLAESWEWSPDGMQITLKLRQGVKWHNKPPVNGRGLEMEDLVFSWQRFAEKNGSRGNIVNSINPDAPVLSVTATDSKTATIRLKEPIVYAIALFVGLGGSAPGVVYPKETDTSFNPRSDIIGTGPFSLANYSPSVGFTFKRNAEYWEKDDALADQIDLPIVPEYATALAHFKAGNIYSMGSDAPGVKTEDILPVKREEPRIQIYQGPFSRSQYRRAFGWLPGGKSPFLDERVRQAASMSWDRDLFVDTFFNSSKFAAQGMPIEAHWNTALDGGFQNWWLDPQGKDFGANGKYFRHDPAEAKKLLAAAGYPNGLQVTSHYVTGTEIVDPKQNEVLDAMSADIGITSKVRSIDYQTEYIPLYRDGKGQWDGWAYKSNAGGGGGSGDSILYLANEYWSKAGAGYHGFSLTGQNDMSGDPEVDALIEKGRVERNTEKRREIAFDLQRRLAKAMYAIPFPAVTTGYVAAWPCLANVRVYQTERLNYRLWVDDAKAPIGKS